MIRYPIVAIAPLLLAACATAPLAEPANAPVAISPEAATYAPGMVSAADPRAAAAGVDMLRRGGNTTDAAIATMLVLNLVEAQNSGIGGGLFWVEHDGKSGRLTTIDGRETAPAAANGQWFLGSDGNPLPIAQRYVGGRSVGVPGALAAMAKAHDRDGKLPWATLFEPAIKLAREGFTVSPRLHNGLQLYGRHVQGWAKAKYFDANGNAVAVGSTLVMPEIADTFARVAREGAAAFYSPENAEKIAAAVRATSLNPAPMVASDITAYQAKDRPPVCILYRAYRVCGMGPPSSGGITVLMILKQLERFDMAALGRTSPVAWHLLAESERLAYADRNAYIGDPDFVSVPVKGLLDPAYLASRSALIDPDSTLTDYEPGRPAGAPAKVKAIFNNDPGTSSLAVADSQGNVVSVTTTVNGYFGSGVAVDGYMLNNELPDFDTEPAKDGYLVANRVEGGKRPRSSMSPTIVYGPDGKVRLAIGAAGGATIICQVAKAIIGVIDWKMSAQDAIAMGLVYAPGSPGGTIEEGTELEAMLPALQALGEKLEIKPLGLKANAIEWVGGHMVGAADPRSEGVAMDTAGNVTQIERRENDLNRAHE
jgi:gamma-glutamyltranspeptidase/glutathione hydrolase